MPAPGDRIGNSSSSMGIGAEILPLMELTVFARAGASAFHFAMVRVEGNYSTIRFGSAQLSSLVQDVESREVFKIWHRRMHLRVGCAKECKEGRMRYNNHTWGIYAKGIVVHLGTG